jgi:hypothetical protein
VQAAVANALDRPADAPAASTTIAIADRNPVPPALARLAGDAEARAGKARIAELVPLPPRRPDTSFMSAAASPAQSSRLIAGAQPILDASRFAPASYSPRADVEPSKDEKFGG